MLKTLNALSGCLALLGVAVCPEAAYTQTATCAADYWPMKKGNTWSMLVKIGPDIKKQVWKITNVEQTNDAAIATLEISSATILQTEHFKVTATQIESLELGGGLYKLDSPMPIVKFPLTAGKTWSYKTTITSLIEEMPVKVAVTFTVSGPFQIKSLAGSFQAMCVHRELVFMGDKGSTHVPMDCWYAPGVGTVQQRYTVSGITPTGNVQIQSYKLEAGRETPKKPPHRHGS